MGVDVTPHATSLHVRLDGFEGPLDLLLELARRQKVDLRQIAMVALVDQYLAVIEGARRIRLDLAAEWLVMAAWLAWLRSRFLVPEGTAEEREVEALAADLTERLMELERMRAAAAWLLRRPWLGIEVFGRGEGEQRSPCAIAELRADLPALLSAYIAARRRGRTPPPYRPPPRRFLSLAEAMARLESLLGATPGWAELERFLPPSLGGDSLARRAALASTFLAGLEMARRGGAELYQAEAFGPILLRRRRPEAALPRATPEEGHHARC